MLEAENWKHLNNKTINVSCFYFFCPESNCYSSDHRLQVNWIRIFQSVPIPLLLFTFFLCLFCCYFWEDLRSIHHTSLKDGQTAKRIYLYMNDIWAAQPKTTCSLLFLSSVPNIYRYVIIEFVADLIYYCFFSLFFLPIAASFIVHFSQICGFRMLNCCRSKTITYIISFFSSL